MLRDGENYFYFWLQQCTKHSDLETVPSQIRRKSWRGTTKYFFFLSPPAKSNFKQSKCILAYFFCLLTSSGFQCVWGVRNPEKKKVQEEGMPYSGSHQARKKRKKASSFSQKTWGFGKWKVLLGEALNHFCPLFCPWLSHLKCFRYLFSLEHLKVLPFWKGFS